MIEIDGSIGEGGGQIVRTSIALSTLLGKSIRIYNIRSSRPKPGLKFQHTVGIKAAAKISNAEISGVKLNSEEITYKPGKIQGGNYEINIKTAGSISLVLQVLMPIMAFAGERITLTNTGGTDVNWSPPVDFIQEVFRPILSSMGYIYNIKINRRGHYPRGGGIVNSVFEPVKYLKPLNIKNYKEIQKIEGISHCVKLPKHVAVRQMNAAKKFLRENNLPEPKIKIEFYKPEVDPHLGPGSGILLWCTPDNQIPLSGDSYGERGKTAEKVGIEAARKLVNEIKSHALLDIHTSDMIIPYLAIADGVSIIKVRNITEHLRTNIEITEYITKTKFNVNKIKNDLYEIKVKGIGLKNKNLT